jgi:OHCU decarboxylase
MTTPVRYLNGLSDEEARAELLRCCHSGGWADAMAAARPFADADELFARAESAWWDLEPTDWLEAFAAHPRIGDRPCTGSTTAEWSSEEQAGMSAADASVHDVMAAGNRLYENRFGHVFLICASGRTGEEMADELARRLQNSPEVELRTAAGEQARITRLRLERLGKP